MLCCAFAAFILSQIVFAFDTVRERLFGASSASPLAGRSASAAWRLGDPAPVAAPRAFHVRRYALMLVFSLALAGGAYAASLHAPASSALHAWHPSAWCSTALAAGGE
jgi:hypothetical protein